MKPVYKSEKYYNVSVVYYNPDTNIKTELDPVRFTIFDSAQDYINTKLEEYKDEIGTTAVQLQEIHIVYNEAILDYSEIIDWIDTRPGDYAIHVNSKNNVSSSIELGYDFYVAKLDRNKAVIVDKYYICWHAYQGSFLISQYQEGSSDKSTNIPVLTIYDERLFPNLDEIETDIGKKWLYAKVAKFASPYAVEEPDREQSVNIEV